MSEGEPGGRPPRYVRPSDVLWRSTATAVLVRRLDGRGMTLTGTGPALWRALDEPKTINELAAALAHEFNAPESEIAADLRSALETMQRDGIVDVIA